MPGASYMVSSMSSAKRRNSSSTRSKGVDTRRRTGSGMVTMGSMDMGHEIGGTSGTVNNPVGTGTFLF